jgi:hypothetical protein
MVVFTTIPDEIDFALAKHNFLVFAIRNEYIRLLMTADVFAGKNKRLSGGDWIN